MPYHMHRRTDCNTDPTRPGRDCRASGSPPREVPQDLQQSRPPALRGGTCQRGIPGSIGPHHGHRAARRLSAGLLKSSGTAGALVPGDLLRQLVYLPQASIFVAEARRDVVGGAVLALPAVGPRRRLRRDGGPPCRGSGPRCGPSDGRAPRGAPPIGPQQGLQRHRSGTPGRSSGADPLGASRIYRKRSAHGTAGGRGGDHHQPDPMIPRAEQRHRAGAADNG